MFRKDALNNLLRRFVGAGMSGIMAISLGLGGAVPALAAQGEGEDARPGVREAPSFDVRDLLAPDGRAASGQGGEQPADPQLDEAAGKRVTIIVQLEPGDDPIPSIPFGLFAQDDRHASCKAEIAALARAFDQAHGSDGASELGGLVVQGDSDGGIEEVADYANAIDGFAVRAPAGILDGIREIDGVKRAFVERVFTVGDSGNASDAAQATSADADVTRMGASAGKATAEAGAPGALSATGLQVPPDDAGLADDAFVPANESALNMTGAQAVAQKGDGQVIAILDSGFDTGHDAFGGALDEAKVAWSRETAQIRRGACAQGGRDAVYVSPKVPFAYDYGDGDANVVPSNGGLDHGAHVAGIAAANGGETRGTAPNAQLVLMKVANDFTGSIRESALLSALDDAVALRPDVLSMSLGSDGGFSAEDSDVMNDAFAKLESQGTTVCISEGNSYTSAKGNRTGQDLAPASDPDVGLSSGPATSVHAAAVASLENARELPCFAAADGRAIPYVEGDRGEGTGFQLFENLQEGTYEYVDAGLGTQGECDALKARYGNLRGKIAIAEDRQVSSGSGLVMSGNRAANLDALRPAAIILYNSAKGALDAKAVNSVNRPVACISYEDGKALANAAVKAITVQKGLTKTPTADYAVNAFSSWGTTPELSLKPDVAAPGGTIYSSVLNNEYGVKSGTSMATPHFAGLCALVREYVAADAKFAQMGADEKRDVVTQLLMSTARPLKNLSTENGYYSPRQQGAGSVDVSQAIATPVFATVDGAEKAAFPKAELGESAQGRWSFTIRLHNLGDTARRYEPATVALAETMADGLFQQVSENYAGAGVDVSYGGPAYDAESGTVVVPAGATASYTVSLSCDDSFKAALSEAVNGTFVEGFALLQAKDDDGVDLSVPYLGFYGDWSAAPVFDAPLSPQGDARRYAPRIVSASTQEQLGANPLAPAGTGTADPARAVMSCVDSEAAPNAVEPLVSLLRGARTLRFTYADAEGRAVRSYSYDYVPKSTKDDTHLDGLVPKPLFTGVDDQGNPVEDGAYTLNVSAETAGPGSQEQSSSFPFVKDTEAPEIAQATVQGEGDGARVAVVVNEGSFLAAIDFVNPSTGNYYKRVMADEGLESVNPDGTRSYSFEVPLENVRQAWVDAGNDAADFPAVPLVAAWDFGLNHQLSEASAESDGFVVDAATGELTAYRGNSSVVVVPDGVSSIAAGAFKGCTAKAIVVPASVRSIGDEAFAATKNLQQVSFQDSDDSPSCLESIGASAFSESSVRDLVLPRSLASLGNGAFSKSGLASIRLPESLKALPALAFSESSVSRVHLPVGLETIGTSAFESCSDLAWVGYEDDRGEHGGLPPSVRTIGDDAFRKSGISTLVLNDGLRSIGSEAFAESALGSLVLPDSVSDLHANALADMKRLTNLVLGAGVAQERVQAAVAGCTSLQAVQASGASTELTSRDGVLFSADGETLVLYPTGRAGAYSAPAQVRTIGARAFRDSSVMSVSFQGSIDLVGEGAFAGSAVQSVDLGPVRAVGDGAFANCSSLSDVDFSAATSLASIGAGAFSPSTPLARVMLPDSVAAVGAAAFANNASLTSVRLGSSFCDDYSSVFAGCDNVSTLQVSPENAQYEVDGCVLYRKADNGYFLQRSLPAGHLLSYEVKEGTVTIGPNAFSGNSDLASLVLPEGLTSIQTAAFAGCASLQSVVFPDSLESVTGFHHTSLKAVEFGTKIREIKSSAFNGHNPSQIIVRGGQSGTYQSSIENGDDQQPLKSAYFGEGMKSADFSAGSIAPPAVVVVPSTMTSLRFSVPSSGLAYEVGDVVVYAPRDTAGWKAAKAALELIGADVSSQLRQREALAVAARGEYDAAVGSVNVMAQATGGALSKLQSQYDYRFIAVGPAGRRVLGDWSQQPTFAGACAADEKVLCEARDATGITASAYAVLENAQSGGGSSDSPDSADAASPSDGQPSAQMPKIVKGKTYRQASQAYKVVQVATERAAGVVTFVRARNAKNIVVPDAVKLSDGKPYAVKRVAAKAFTSSKIRRVTLGKNVQALAKQAFGKSKAQVVVLKTKKLARKSVKGCFKGSSVRTVKVAVGSTKANKRYAAKYQKVFTKKTCGRSVTVMHS
ncbi:MAG TPA: hypothetical protein DCP91_09070 [Eggerthellaceae bacterium]|nr:hypothetical protein [Eggerthellaceae bacterium]